MSIHPVTVELIGSEHKPLNKLMPRERSLNVIAEMV